MTLDPLAFRREDIRWICLRALDNAMPVGFPENLLLRTVRDLYQDATDRELRHALAYLKARGLIEISELSQGLWHATLTRYGMDVTEYTVPCDAGIARPEKYW